MTDNPTGPTSWGPEETPAPAMPVATPAPAAYAAYPPPVVPAPVEAIKTRKAPPWWVWTLASGVALFAVLAMVAVAVFLNRQSESFSPNYSGAPVEAADASDSTIVSASATVSYDIPAQWVNAADYFDLSAATSSFMTGQSMVATHFTVDPNVATPQLVMVVEQIPETMPAGDLPSMLEGYFGGMKSSGAQFENPTPKVYSTPNGLEGYVADFSPGLSGTPTEARVVVLGQGRRVVLVQWISYDGPVDTAAMDTMLATLRIDD